MEDVLEVYKRPYDPLRPLDLPVMTGETVVVLDKGGRLLGRLQEEVVSPKLFKVLAVVLPHAEKLLGVGHRRMERDRRKWKGPLRAPIPLHAGRVIE